MALNTAGDTLTYSQTAGGDLASAGFSLSLSGTTVTGSLNVDIYGMLDRTNQVKLALYETFIGESRRAYLPPMSARPYRVPSELSLCSDRFALTDSDTPSPGGQVPFQQGTSDAVVAS